MRGTRLRRALDAVDRPPRRRDRPSRPWTWFRPWCWIRFGCSIRFGPGRWRMFGRLIGLVRLIWRRIRRAPVYRRGESHQRRRPADVVHEDTKVQPMPPLTHAVGRPAYERALTAQRGSRSGPEPQGSRAGRRVFCRPLRIGVHGGRDRGAPCATRGWTSPPPWSSPRPADPPVGRGRHYRATGNRAGPEPPRSRRSARPAQQWPGTAPEQDTTTYHHGDRRSAGLLSTRLSAPSHVVARVYRDRAGGPDGPPSCRSMASPADRPRRPGSPVAASRWGGAVAAHLR